MGRQLGVEHSQRLESYFQSVPGLHNLPYGIFKPTQAEESRPGVAIGEYMLDLSVLS